MELPSLSPTIQFIAIIVGMALISLLLRFLSPEKAKKSKVDLQIYNLRDSILTKNELNFYKALSKVVEGDTVILSKVRLWDIFSVSRGSGYQAAVNRINSKHIDFILCEEDSFRPLVAIELDDSSHNRKDRIARDQFVNNLFAAQKLPLVRFPAKGRYDAREIEEQLKVYMEG